MTLEQLRIFVATAERQHVTQAGRDLNLTQSAVSAAISALEASYSIKLFDRIGRRIELTEVGRLFLIEARAVLARAAAAEAVLSDLAGLQRGSLVLAASQTVANYWLPRHVHQYHAAYPGIRIETLIGNTQTVSTMVRDGVAQLGFVEGAIDDPALSIVQVDEDELVIVIGSAHAAKGTRLSTQDFKGLDLKDMDLKEMPWVVREPGSGTRAVFEAAMLAAGIQPSEINIQLELPSNEAVSAAVKAGAGAAMLSKLVVDSSIGSGALERLKIDLPKRPFYMLRHKERYVTQAERAFIRVVEASAGERKSLSAKTKSFSGG
jgi:DNA-binding transcriptional LysR family regulator